MSADAVTWLAKSAGFRPSSSLKPIRQPSATLAWCRLPATSLPFPNGFPYPKKLVRGGPRLSGNRNAFPKAGPKDEGHEARNKVTCVVPSLYGAFSWVAPVHPCTRDTSGSLHVVANVAIMRQRQPLFRHRRAADGRSRLPASRDTCASLHIPNTKMAYRACALGYFFVFKYLISVLPMVPLNANGASS